MSEHKFNTTPSKTINKPKQNNPKGYNYDCNLVPYLRIASVECNLNGISSTIEICFVCNVIPHQIYIYRYIYVENKHDTTHIHTHTKCSSDSDPPCCWTSWRNVFCVILIRLRSYHMWMCVVYIWCGVVVPPATRFLLLAFRRCAAHCFVLSALLMFRVSPTKSALG